MKAIFQLAAAFLLMSAAVPAMAEQVPEPVSMSLLAVGAGGLMAVRALRRRGK